MDALSKYVIPLFDSADPAVAAPDPAATPVITDPAVATPQSDPQGGKLPDSVISEITALRAKNRETEERAARAEREASNYRAIAERVQSGGNNKDTPPATFTHTNQPAQIDDAEIDQRAERKLFLRDVEELKQAGLREFGEAFIAEGVRPAESAGATDDRIVSEILAVDKANAHKLIYEIGKDWNRARALAQMSSAQRIAEITRMSIAMTDKAKAQASAPTAPAAPAPTKQASKAPAPPPVIDPGTTKTIDWRSDEASDEEFDRGFEEMVKTRMMRR